MAHALGGSVCCSVRGHGCNLMAGSEWRTTNPTNSVGRWPSWLAGRLPGRHPRTVSQTSQLPQTKTRNILSTLEIGVRLKDKLGWVSVGSLGASFPLVAGWGTNRLHPNPNPTPTEPADAQPTVCTRCPPVLRMDAFLALLCHRSKSFKGGLWGCM